MRFLDERGRVFGKINVVDFAVAVGVVVAIGWFGYAKFGRNLRADIAQRERAIEVTVCASNIRLTTVDAIRESKKVFEFKTGAFIGEVVDIRSEPSEVWFLNGDGRWAMTRAEDRADAYVTVRGNARFGDDVITMNGVEMRVGSSIGLKSKFAAFTGYVVTMDLEPKDEDA